MQRHRDPVRTDFPPLTGLAARAEVLDINLVLDDHRSAEGGAVVLHHAAQERRLPIGTQHLAELDVGAGALDHIPTGGFLQ